MHENMILSVKNIWGGEERKPSSKITVLHSGTNGDGSSLIIYPRFRFRCRFSNDKEKSKWSPSTIYERRNWEWCVLTSIEGQSWMKSYFSTNHSYIIVFFRTVSFQNKQSAPQISHSLPMYDLDQNKGKSTDNSGPTWMWRCGSFSLVQPIMRHTHNQTTSYKMIVTENKYGFRVLIQLTGKGIQLAEVYLWITPVASLPYLENEVHKQRPWAP